MSVPITYLSRHCPEQFEILGITLGNTVAYEMTTIYENAIQHNKDGSTQSESKVNTRVAQQIFQTVKCFAKPTTGLKAINNSRRLSCNNGRRLLVYLSDKQATRHYIKC
jgi:hypothetical protein